MPIPLCEIVTYIHLGPRPDFLVILCAEKKEMIRGVTFVFIPPLGTPFTWTRLVMGSTNVYT